MRKISVLNFDKGTDSSDWSFSWFFLALLDEFRNSIHPLTEIFFSVLTYLLTPWSRVLLEKLTGFAANQIPRILWNPKVHSRTDKLPPPAPQPLPTSWRSILILSSHLRLGLPNGLFPSGFPNKTLCTPLSSSIHTTSISFFLILSPAQYWVSSIDY